MRRVQSGPFLQVCDGGMRNDTLSQVGGGQPQLMTISESGWRAGPQITQAPGSIGTQLRRERVKVRPREMELPTAVGIVNMMDLAH
jgi:hypothetical protein